MSLPWTFQNDGRSACLAHCQRCACFRTSRIIQHMHENHVCFVIIIIIIIIIIVKNSSSFSLHRNCHRCCGHHHQHRYHWQLLKNWHEIIWHAQQDWLSMVHKTGRPSGCNCLESNIKEWHLKLSEMIDQIESVGTPNQRAVPFLFRRRHAEKGAGSHHHYHHNHHPHDYHPP